MARELDDAIRFLKSRCVLVSVVDRDAWVRTYYVSGWNGKHTAQEVIDAAANVRAQEALA
jgi:hypothetical protein